MVREFRKFGFAGHKRRQALFLGVRGPWHANREAWQRKCLLPSIVGNRR